jgi:hypothetical protein
MKKVNFKKVLMTMVVAFTFLLGAQAQSEFGSGLFSTPQGSFVGVDQAKTMLNAELPVMKAALETYSPGSGLYVSTERKFLYYRSMLEYLNSSTPTYTVATVIPTALQLFTTDAFPTTSKTTLAQMKADAVSFLSN